MLSKEFLESQSKKLGVNKDGKVLVYKYIDLEGGKLLIDNSTFKFSKPNEFNDPFDLYDELIDFKEHLVDTPLTYTRQERRKVEKASLKRKISFLKQSWKKQRSNYGITCFSKTYNNILMWSHYSDSHTGICIGLEIDANKFLDSGFIAFAVEYEENFHPRPYSEKDFSERIKTMMQYVSLKADFWKYEQEVRFVKFEYFEKHNSNLLSFSDFAKIKEIYFGLKAKESDRKEIKKLVSKHNNKVDYYIMSPVKNKFELERIKTVPNKP